MRLTCELDELGIGPISSSSLLSLPDWVWLGIEWGGGNVGPRFFSEGEGERLVWNSGGSAGPKEHVTFSVAPLPPGGSN